MKPNKLTKGTFSLHERTKGKVKKANWLVQKNKMGYWCVSRFIEGYDYGTTVFSSAERILDFINKLEKGIY